MANSRKLTVMTSRERVEAALSHQTPDRTPVFEYVLLPPIADLLLGRPYASYDSGERWQAAVDILGWEGGVRQNAIDRLDLARILGHDMLYIPGNPPPSTEPPPQANPSGDPPDDPVTRLHLRNEREEQEPPDTSCDSFLIYSMLKEEMQWRGEDLPILAPAYGHGVWTDIDLMQAMVLEPEVAARHFSLATRRVLSLIDNYAELSIDQIGVGGDFAGNRPLISPECYRQFIVSEVRTLSRRVHSFGGWAVNASDGNLWPVIDDFLIGCEADGYLEIDSRAGMDMGRLKMEYGDRITFYGNLDCGNVLSFATPDEVRREVKECIEAGWGNGGHIFCASNAITESVPVVNYVAMVNEYRDIFGLGRLSLE